MYSQIVKIRNYLYSSSVFKSKKLPLPVISVGNISVGGSGKTPLVLEILNQCPGLCVLTRGYKSEVTLNKQYPTHVPDGLNPKKYGDEPSLIRSHFPSAMVVIDPDRHRGGVYALKQGQKIEGFILDDGFQHRQLHRDLDIVVFDLEIFLKNYKLLPFGRFRETMESLKRAHIVLVTKWSHVNPLDIENSLKELKKFSASVHLVSMSIREVKNMKGISKNKGSVILLSGIGHPEIFEKDVKSQFPGLNILEHIKHKDHHSYTLNEMKMLLKKAEKSKADILCTEKDYIKIKTLSIDLESIYFTEQKISLNPDVIEHIQNTITKKIKSSVETQYL